MRSLENVVHDIYEAITSENWEETIELLNTVPQCGRPLPHVTFSMDDTVFHMAVEFRAPFDVLAALIQSFGIETISAIDIFEQTPLHSMPFWSDLQRIDLVARAYPQAIVAHNRDERTPIDALYRRIMENDEIDNFTLQAMTNLLSIYPEAIHNVDKWGRTLLHRCFLGFCNKATRTAIVLFLVSKKKELTAIRDSTGKTALHLVSRDQNGGHLVELLLQNTPKSLWTAQDNQGQTALHFAISWWATWDVVVALIKACPEIVDVPDNKGNLPLDFFVKRNGPEFTVHSFHRNLRLWQNEARKNYDSLRLLLVAGSPAEVTNNGKLIVHAALYNTKCPLVLVTFLIVGFPELLSLTDTNGNLPIHLAAQRTFQKDDRQAYVDVITELCKWYPDGAKMENQNGKLPLALMIEAHQPWAAVKPVLEVHPAAIHDQSLGVFETCTLLSRLNVDVCYQLLCDVPSLLEQYQMV